MAKKVPVEIKAKALRHYLTEKFSAETLRRFVLANYGYDVTRQAICKWIKQKDEILETQTCIGMVF